MKWKTGVILIGLVLFLEIAGRGKDELVCPKSPVEAAVGEDVTLDCSLETPRDVTNELFEWIFNGSDRVLVYRSKGFSHPDRAKQHSSRASLDSSGDLTKGKLPLNILSVQKTDAGRYSCSVGRERAKISCSIELIVVDKKGVAQEPNSTLQRGNCANIGIVIAALAFLFFAV